MEDLRDEWEGVVPVPNGITEEFWAATTEGTLLVQRCLDCGEYQFYPRTVCTHCGARDPEYVESDGTGQLFSYTVCHVPGAAGFGDRTPYAVGIIELDEGPRLTAHVASDPDAVAVGSRVAVDFWRVTDGAAIPVFDLAQG